MLTLLLAMTTQASPVEASVEPVSMQIEHVATVGDDERRAADLFGSISSVVAVGDRIYVFDAFDVAIKVYSTTGERVGTWGRGGDGPGEFAGSATLAVDGPLLHAFDRRSKRVAVFDLDDGRLLQDDRLELPSNLSPADVAVLSGDGFLVSTGAQFSSEPGETSVDAHLYLVRSGSPPEKLDSWAIGLAYWVGAKSPFPAFARMAFGPEIVWALSQEGMLAMVDGYGGAIRFIDMTAPGRPVTAEVRLDWTPGEIRDVVRKEALAEIEAHSRRLDRGRVRADDVVYPRGFSNAWDALFDDSGALWVMERPDLEVERAARVQRWYVFDPKDPSIVRTVEMPPGLHVRAIVDRYVVGTGRTELDAPTLEIYRMELRLAPTGTH